MKKKIYTRMTIISVIFTIITMIASVGIFYNMYRSQVMEDLKTHVHILKTTEAVLEYIEKDFDPKIDNLRITVIDSDGKVEYDSNADIGSMDNHGNRPEVKQALKTGSGSAIRESGTLEKNTYYYAEKMNDGQIIRVAKEAGNLWQFGAQIFPIFLVVLILAIGVSLVVAKLLAKSLIKPIELMAQHLEDDKATETYEEIQPFMDKIHSQHKALKKSSKMRQEFTANVSHELKTPLASISGYAEIMKSGLVKPEDMKGFAERIYNEARRLITLVEDIIKLSKLDEGNVQLEKEEVDLYKLTREILTRLSPQAAKRKVHVEVTGEPVEYVGIRQILDEMIYNICENAIKYNKEGGKLTVWVGNTLQGKKVCVTDTGIGIPENETDRIFERFYRVDKSHSKETGGTGLGLSIVKHGAMLHGAKIHVDSKLGEGTKIELIF